MQFNLWSLRFDLINPYFLMLFVIIITFAHSNKDRKTHREININTYIHAHTVCKCLSPNVKFRSVMLLRLCKTHMKHRKITRNNRITKQKSTEATATATQAAKNSTSNSNRIETATERWELTVQHLHDHNTRTHTYTSNVSFIRTMLLQVYILIHAWRAESERKIDESTTHRHSAKMHTVHD